MATTSSRPRPPTAQGRAKDKDYVTKLGELSNARLLDMQGRACKAPAAAKAPPGSRRAKPATKPAPNAKSASKKA